MDLALCLKDINTCYSLLIFLTANFYHWLCSADFLLITLAVIVWFNTQSTHSLSCLLNYFHLFLCHISQISNYVRS